MTQVSDADADYYYDYTSDMGDSIGSIIGIGSIGAESTDMSSRQNTHGKGICIYM